MPYLGIETESCSQDDANLEPATAEEAKKEVADALKEIWASLPESERSSAVKRLIRRWHPDKNPHCKQLATEATKFLLNEVDRLKAGGISGYHPKTDDSNKSSTKPLRSDGTSTWDDGPNFWDFFNRYEKRWRRQRKCHHDWWNHRGKDYEYGTAYRKSSDKQV